MAIPRYKDIVDLVKKGSTLEAQEKILELREAAIELQEENLALKEQLSKLKHSKTIGKELVFKEGLYFSSENDGPFCPGCYDTSGKQIRVTEQTGLSRKAGAYKCPSCKEFFK